MLSRTFPAGAFLGALAMTASQAAIPTDVVKIHVEPDTVISRISPEFAGFGYETAAVAQTNYFGATNLSLVRLYRNLGSHGLIRIGGIISDHTLFVPDGRATPRTQDEVTIINEASLKRLGEFARATGWKVMWGLNLGTGSKNGAVHEALAVNAALGTSLHSFQIGNEVEDLRRFDGNYTNYYATYVAYKSAIRAVLPEAPFSGPDVASNWKWLTNFVGTESADIQLITQHYYRGGAKNPTSTLERLLQPDAAFETRLAVLRQLSRNHQREFRINEVNSYSGGGKPGVSDTFGSALWCLDYMFRLASAGCEGVNMETDVNQLGFISYYSPIVHDEAGHCTARPEYYGMLAFALGGKGDVVGLTLENANRNPALSAYATKERSGLLWITVVNKGDAVLAKFDLPEGYGGADVFRLVAPSLDSKGHVTFAGQQVQTDGTWTPGLPEKCVVNHGIAELNLPSASAAVLRVQR